MKRLFYDIETSLGIYSNFGQGWNKTISYKDEIVEPRIICICYKFPNEKVQSLEWDMGDDKRMIKKFIEVLDSADEIVGHNADGFDLPWIRGRAIKHRLEMAFDYPAVDTLKLAKRRAGKGFKFQSNRLDYIARYFGVGKKIKTDLSLWQNISYHAFMPNRYPDSKAYENAMKDMVKYCKMDVQVLEDVYNVLMPYVPHKHNYAAINDDYRHNCPQCSSGNIIKKGNLYSSVGILKRRMKCKDCGKQYQLSNKMYMEWLTLKATLDELNANLK